VASKQKILALTFAIIGLTIGHIGYDVLRREHFLSAADFLPSGIPFVPVFIGFLMLPELFHHARHTLSGVDINSNEFGIRTRLANLLKFPPVLSSLRGSVIGAVMGLVPMIGTSVSSMVAAVVEKKINNNNQRIVVSAEAANNSAAITVLIPLIFLALPIIPSEAVIMALAERSGFGINNSFNLIASLAGPLIVILLLVNVVNWLVAGMFYQSMISLYIRLNKIIYPILIAVSVAVCVSEGMANHQLGLYLLLTAMSVCVGVFVKEFSVRVALIFGMLLSTSVSSEIFRFVLFNF
jgi:putative tricarboxylic transport membrane protein